MFGYKKSKKKEKDILNVIKSIGDRIELLENDMKYLLEKDYVEKPKRISHSSYPSRDTVFEPEATLNELRYYREREDSEGYSETGSEVSESILNFIRNETIVKSSSMNDLVDKSGGFPGPVNIDSEYIQGNTPPHAPRNKYAPKQK